MTMIKLTLPAVLSLVTFVGSALCDDGVAPDQSCRPEDRIRRPVISMGDFDRDGVVTCKDIRAIIQQVEKGEYLALYDRNADGALNQDDVEIVRLERRRGSNPQDQEIVRLFEATERYRDRTVAELEGFRPITQDFKGHGTYLIRPPAERETNRLDYTFDLTSPEGLIYDTDRALVGVFYYFGPDPIEGISSFRPEATPPDAFWNVFDTWESRAGVCLLNANWEKMQDPLHRVIFKECASPSRCTSLASQFYDEGAIDSPLDVVWNPRFHLLRVWLYRINACGLFSPSHEDVALRGEDPADTTAPHGEPNRTCEFDPRWTHPTEVRCDP
jgi:hypothetical protein